MLLLYPCSSYIKILRVRIVALLHHNLHNSQKVSEYVLCYVTGRTEDLGQDVLDRFTEFSLEQGILPENIAVLPKNGKINLC